MSDRFIHSFLQPKLWISETAQVVNLWTERGADPPWCIANLVGDYQHLGSYLIYVHCQWSWSRVINCLWTAAVHRPSVTIFDVSPGLSSFQATTSYRFPASLRQSLRPGWSWCRLWRIRGEDDLAIAAPHLISPAHVFPCPRLVGVLLILAAGWQASKQARYLAFFASHARGVISPMLHLMVKML